MKMIGKKTKNKIFSFFSIFTLLMLAFIFLLTFCFGAIRSVAGVVRADCSAKAMCLLEGESGRVLAEKNSSSRYAMASTTKIMTAITAIENAEDLDEIFEISKNAVGVSGTSIYLREGERMSLRDLLYGLMLVSGNDASVAIAERVGGSVEHFVDLMNFTAHRLGAKNTHFENTHGLDEKGHYTSAYDLAKIAAYALKNDIFREIVSTKSKKIVSAEGKERYLNNKNKLLRTFDGAIGVKTGFTDDAGRCLVAASERNGMTLVCVVLNCGPMFEECASMMEWGYQKYKMVDLTDFVCLPKSIPVIGGQRDEVSIGHHEKFMFPLAEGEEEKVQVEIALNECAFPPSSEGKIVGEFKILYANSLLFLGKVVTMESVRTRSLMQRLSDIAQKW